MGEAFEKTYFLESQRENQGYFRFSLNVRKGGSLGAEGYALYTLRNITGYSTADTSDIAFPATVRLYDEIGQIVGISSKNVSVKLVRIREELKNMNN